MLSSTLPLPVLDCVSLKAAILMQACLSPCRHAQRPFWPVGAKSQSSIVLRVSDGVRELVQDQRGEPENQPGTSHAC